MAQEITEIGIKVKRIKEVAFYLNEHLYRENQDERVKIFFQQILDITDQLVLTLRAYFAYDDSEEIIADLHVRNTFEVDQLHRFQTEDDNVVLPFGCLNLMVDLAISHSRALFQRNLAGTSLENISIPIVDARNITSTLFAAEKRTSEE